MVTVESVRAYVGAAATDTAHIQGCLDAATDMVTRRTRGSDVPDTILALATREVAADLFHRRATRNGVAGFDGGGDVQPVRITRDPMRAADDILAPYLKPGLA